MENRSEKSANAGGISLGESSTLNADDELLRLERVLPDLPVAAALVWSTRPPGEDSTEPDNWFASDPPESQSVEVALSRGANDLAGSLHCGGDSLVEIAAQQALVAGPGSVRLRGLGGGTKIIRYVPRVLDRGLYVEFIDDTDQNPKEVSEALLRVEALEKILEALPVAVFVKDPRDSFRIKRVNRSFEETFGIKREDVIDVFDYELFPEDLCNKYRACDEAVIREGSVMRVEEEIMTPYGPRIARTLKLPLFDENGEPELLVGMLQDITDHRQAMMQVDEARALKSRFLHGLGLGAKSQLAGLIGHLDDSLAAVTMQRGDVATSIDSARRLARHLELRIEEVLDINHMSAGRREANWQAYDPADVARDSAHSCARSALAGEVTVTVIDERALLCGASREIQGDAERLRQALTHLISNAVKFSHRGAAVDVVLTQKSPARRVTIEVRDEGIGIPADEVERLFSEVTEIPDGRSFVHEGTGLGLTIARQLVQLTGGQLYVQSELGVGSTFSIELASLPVGSGTTPGQALDSDSVQGSEGLSAAGRALSPASQRVTASCRVLVAENNVAHQRIIRRHLEAAGHEVVMTSNTDEVLAILRTANETVDIALIDLRIPGVDCLQLIESIRRQSVAMPRSMARLQVIAVSSWSPGSAEAQEEESRALAAGADACLFKPLSPGALSREVQRRSA